jgi:hypothetical protein
VWISPVLGRFSVSWHLIYILCAFPASLRHHSFMLCYLFDVTLLSIYETFSVVNNCVCIYHSSILHTTKCVGGSILVYFHIFYSALCVRECILGPLIPRSGLRDDYVCVCTPHVSCVMYLLAELRSNGVYINTKL